MSRQSAFDSGERVAIQAILSHILGLQAAIMADNGLPSKDILKTMRQIISTTLEAADLRYADLRHLDTGEAVGPIVFEELVRRASIEYSDKVFSAIG